jgi:hypothetical protein
MPSPASILSTSAISCAMSFSFAVRSWAAAALPPSMFAAMSRCCCTAWINFASSTIGGMPLCSSRENCTPSSAAPMYW